MTRRPVGLQPKSQDPHGPRNTNLPAGTDQAHGDPHGCTQTISVTGGIKRRRSGSIASHQYHARHLVQSEASSCYHDAEASSEDDDDLSTVNRDFDSSDDSEDSFDSDDGELDTDDETSATYGDIFRDAKRSVVNSSYGAFSNWADSEKYVAPPDDRLPPRKRARISKEQHCSACAGGLKNDSNTQHGAARATGYFHLACPFYLANPQKYKHCLLEHELPSIEAVIQHLKRHHRKPPYCPRCYETFVRVLDRDGHILRRQCKLSDEKQIDGLNEYQQERLSKRDKLYYGEATRWKRIGATVFPGVKPCHGPYLDNGRGLRVSLARDYWREHGQRLILQFLDSRGSDVTQAERGKLQVALSKLILQDLLKQVYGEGDLDKNCGLEIRIKSELTPGDLDA